MLVSKVRGYLYPCFLGVPVIVFLLDFQKELMAAKIFAETYLVPVELAVMVVKIHAVVRRVEIGRFIILNPCSVDIQNAEQGGCLFQNSRKFGHRTDVFLIVAGHELYNVGFFQTDFGKTADAETDLIRNHLLISISGRRISALSPVISTVCFTGKGGGSLVATFLL